MRVCTLQIVSLSGLCSEFESRDMDIFKTWDFELPFQGQDMAKTRSRGGFKKKPLKSLGYKKLWLPR